MQACHVAMGICWVTGWSEAEGREHENIELWKWLPEAEIECEVGLREGELTVRLTGEMISLYAQICLFLIISLPLFL